MPISDPASLAFLHDEGMVQGIDHVGLAVADLDAAIELHTRVFGWRLVHTETNPDQHVAEAMLGLGDGSGHQAQLQLLAPLDPSSTIARFLDRRGPGLQQLAYRVGDVVEAAAAIRRHGLRLLYDAPRRGTADSLINFVHPGDTFGVLIELVQRSDAEVPKNSSQEPGKPRSTGGDDRLPPVTWDTAEHREEDA